MKNITFISTRVTESTPKNKEEENGMSLTETVHEPLLLGSESECLECAIYGYESVEEIAEIIPESELKEDDGFSDEVRVSYCKVINF